MRSNYSTITPGMRTLSDEQIREVFSNTIAIMEEVGQVIHNEEAVKLLLDAGASRRADGRILIPSHMVEAAIRTTPKKITIYDRDGNINMRLEGYNTYFGGITDAPDFLDPYTLERRPYESKDWISCGIVHDYLPHMKFAHICGNATDIKEPKLAYREIGYQSFLNTRVTLALCMGDADAMRDLIELSEVVAGGAEEFKRKPNVFAMSEPVTPLDHPDDSVERLLMCAEHMVPIVYYGMQMQGTTAPATNAGIVSLALAETFTGLVIHQLKQPGAPYIVGGIPAMLNFKTTMFSYGAPELVSCSMAMSDVAHYFNLPVWGTTTTDAKHVDAQCAIEFTVSSMAAMMNGQNLIHDCGQLDKASLVALQATIMCDEIVEMLSYIQRGVEVNEEQLALDVIKKVGPRGNFMGQKSTLNNFKKFWSSDVFDCTAAEMKVEPMDIRLNNKLKDILENHKVPPVDKDRKKEMDKLREKWLAKYQ